MEMDTMDRAVSLWRLLMGHETNITQDLGRYCFHRPVDDLFSKVTSPPGRNDKKTDSCTH